jgi:hypothetical protein
VAFADEQAAAKAMLANAMRATPRSTSFFCCAVYRRDMYCQDAV